MQPNNKTEKFHRDWRMDNPLTIDIFKNGKAIRESAPCFPFLKLETEE